jgi:CRP/FNR family transcriptional regulator, cyclic AMP receptor protein
MQENPSVFYRVWGEDNIAYGPVELPGLVDWIRQGRVSRTDWVFREDKAEWSRAADITELKVLFKAKATGGTSASTVQGIAPGSLRRIKVFAEMEERHLASFLTYMEVVNLLPNAVVFRKGEQGDSMFAVLQGEVRARTIVGGRESTLSTMGVGECFGELAIVDESTRSAEVVANVETVLLKISATNLKRLFQEAPALAAPFLLGLSRTITSRVRALTKRYEDSILFARTAGQK